MNALILVGGKSSRMGFSKSHICYKKDIPIYIDLANSLKPYFETVYLSSNNEQVALFENELPILVDKIDSIGPIGALFTYFDHFDDDVFTVACDMPGFSIDLVEKIIQIKPDDLDVIFCTSKEFKQPLFAVYYKSCKYEIIKAVQSHDYKLMNLIGNLKVKSIEVDSSILLNINSRSELRKYLGTS